MSWTNPNIQQVVPLIQAGSLTGSPLAAVVTAASSFTALNLVDVSLFTSYDINLYAYAVSPGAVASVIVGQVRLQWFDDLVSGIPVFEEDWFYWVGRAQLLAPLNNPLAGCGPMHGKFMSVTFFVPPGAASGMNLQWVNIYGSNRSVPYSDYRQNAQIVNPQDSSFGNIAGSGTSFDNVLAETFATLTTNATALLLCGLYAGPAYYQFQFSNTPNQTVTLLNMSGVLAGQIIAGTGTSGILVANGAAGEVAGNVILPRGPCLWVIHANATTGGTVNFITVAQQAA